MDLQGSSERQISLVYISCSERSDIRRSFTTANFQLRFKIQQEGPSKPQLTETPRQNKFSKRLKSTSKFCARRET